MNSEQLANLQAEMRERNSRSGKPIPVEPQPRLIETISTTCSVKGCHSPIKYRTLQLCNNHYKKSPERAAYRHAHKKLPTASQLYCVLKYRAKERGLEMSLTPDEFRLLRGKFCAYCGGELPLQGHGIDRVDNDEGYSWDNSVPCCSECNYLKADDLTAEEMRAVMNVRVPIERQLFIDKGLHLFKCQLPL